MTFFFYSVFIVHVGLVRCAHSRFLSATTQTLKECTEILFNRHLLPYAQRSDVDAFRSIIAQPRIQQIYQKYQLQLQYVFLEKAGQDGVIQLDEFAIFLKEKGVVNAQFPKKQIVKIFNCVQDEVAGSTAEESEGGDGDEDACLEDMEMVSR